MIVSAGAEIVDRGAPDYAAESFLGAAMTGEEVKCANEEMCKCANGEMCN